MYLIRTFLLLGLLSSRLPVCAQDSIPGSPFPVHYFIFYVEPLAALDASVGQSYRLGVEYARKDWGAYVTAGWYLQQGFIVRTGLKLFTYADQDSRGSIVLEYLYAWHVHTVKDWYWKADSTNPDGAIPDQSRPPVIYLDDKYITTLSIQFANEMLFFHHFVFGVYAGLGVKFREALINIPQSLQDQLYAYKYTDYTSPDYRGRNLLPDIRFGIKLGYLHRCR